MAIPEQPVVALAPAVDSAFCVEGDGQVDASSDLRDFDIAFLEPLDRFRRVVGGLVAVAERANICVNSCLYSMKNRPRGQWSHRSPT